MSEHRKDESKPVDFIRYVGPVYSCTCGRDVVAGYECQGAIDERPATGVTP